MSTTNRHTTNNNRRETTNGHLPYFLFVITNYPNVVQRTQRYQRPNQDWQRQYHGGMLIPGVQVHFGDVRTVDHEQLLYNTLRYQLQQLIRQYLYQTHQSYPIYLVFDMSNMNFPFL